jgi:hypothetical protein
MAVGDWNDLRYVQGNKKMDAQQQTKKLSQLDDLFETWLQWEPLLCSDVSFLCKMENIIKTRNPCESRQSLDRECSAFDAFCLLRESIILRRLSVKSL